MTDDAEKYGYTWPLTPLSDFDPDACCCKADPPRCPNAGQSCFCPGYCLPNPNCRQHGYSSEGPKWYNSAQGRLDYYKEAFKPMRGHG